MNLSLCILYNQGDATYTMFFIIYYLLLFCIIIHPNHTSGRQQKSMTIPKAAHTVLQAHDDRRKKRPKRVER